ncbi:MAG: transposon-encoded TnpW family protein [Oscillospiraceae bacterium]|jgi:hypothetical protein|nr:transposon-encoded TnpW family protein [Oscillospiraceae bacterium]
MTELKTITTAPKSIKMKRKIGSTVYEVSLFFSDTSKESINDKIARLIRNDPQINSI